MTKTEILKFCGNSIYPNAYRAKDRATDDVYRTILRNIDNDNREHKLFYTRNRGINCIAMKMIELISTKDLAGIIEGIVSYKDVEYIKYMTDNNKKVHVFRLNNSIGVESKQNNYYFYGYDGKYGRLPLSSILDGINLMLYAFQDIGEHRIASSVNLYGEKYGKYKILSESKLIDEAVIFCAKIPFTYNGVAVTITDAVDLATQSQERVSSFLTNGGISKIEAMQNFDRPMNSLYNHADKIIISYLKDKRRYHDSL